MVKSITGITGVQILGFIISHLNIHLRSHTARMIQVFDHINVTNHLPEETLFCDTLKYMKIKMTIEVLTMTKKRTRNF